MEQRALTVSALTKYIKVKLEGDTHLKSINLEGEISNFTHHSSGHMYFTLKDDKSQIRAMMFAGATQSLEFRPKAGDKVVVRGNISLYEPRGEYSINIFQMKQQGLGKLYEEYEKLKKLYEEQGYFDPARKKAIPKFPKAIGVVTSPTGAVIQDIINTVNRRYPMAKVILYPANVQGVGASLTIKNKIEQANQDLEVDVLIVGRGGGSIEDLWPFNEIEAIEAIINSKIPIIAAIGHETDFTISDFVADLRSPTPTAAAEQATPNQIDLIENLNYNQKYLKQLITDYINTHKTKLMNLEQQMSLLSPENKLKNYIERVNNYIHQMNRQYQFIYLNNFNKYERLTKSLNPSYERLFNVKKQSFLTFTERLSGLNPLNYLDKGFALTKRDNKVITSVKQINISDELSITYQDGTIKTKVIEKG